jgi:benzoyl-CoA reductase subunit D
MYTAGIDLGAKTIEIVIVEDGRIVAKNITSAGHDLRESLEKAWAGVLEQSGVERAKIEKVAAAGAGRNLTGQGWDAVTDAAAAAKGAFALDNSVRTVIDVGAEDSRAVKIDEKGNILDFAVNEKCAAGAGAFTEAMARALEVPIEELGPLSLRGAKSVVVNAHCAVFAESELVALIHNQTARPDMARAIHDAISARIVSMVRRVGMQPNVMLIGGLARNVGFVHSLKNDLKHDAIVPEGPEFVGAYGAALIAAEKA